MRLDKYLANMSVGTRSEVKKIIKSGRVFVNGKMAKKPEEKVEPEDEISFDGEIISYEKYCYIMLNKPQGVVSATQDEREKTVISLLREDMRKKDLFPVGRLDKDTEGLLLLTNDGELAHELLSPRKHVWKTYLVRTQGQVGEEERKLLETGVDIGEKEKTLPAKVELCEEKETIKLSIHEGKFHQVKRMLAAVGCPVVFLKRLTMGNLQLDPSLEAGEYRFLTQEEIESLRASKIDLEE